MIGIGWSMTSHSEWLWLSIWFVVTGTMEFYDFPYIGNVIIPTDELIFFRGVETTNQLWFFSTQEHAPFWKDRGLVVKPLNSAFCFIDVR